MPRLRLLLLDANVIIFAHELGTLTSPKPSETDSPNKVSKKALPVDPSARDRPEHTNDAGQQETGQPVPEWHNNYVTKDTAPLSPGEPCPVLWLPLLLVSHWFAFLASACISQEVRIRPTKYTASR